MKYFPENIAIIIPTNGSENEIYKVFKSIISQTAKPGQIIVVSTKQINLKSYKKFFFHFIKKKNQVYQRTLAKNYIKKLPN